MGATMTVSRWGCTWWIALYPLSCVSFWLSFLPAFGRPAMTVSVKSPSSAKAVTAWWWYCWKSKAEDETLSNWCLLLLLANRSARLLLTLTLTDQVIPPRWQLYFSSLVFDVSSNLHLISIFLRFFDLTFWGIRIVDEFDG